MGMYAHAEWRVVVVCVRCACGVRVGAGQLPGPFARSQLARNSVPRGEGSVEEWGVELN